MSLERAIVPPEDRAEQGLAVLVRPRLQEQFRDLGQQHEVASLGMWVFLATEVMFFGTLFLGLGVYRALYPEAFEKASERLNWIIGGLNTVVLLVSSLMMVLAVHHGRHGQRRQLLAYLGLTAALGACFLCLKGREYYLDYVEYLIPGWRFDEQAWLADGLQAKEIPHVKLFLVFYWIMTGFHALHVVIGILAVLAMLLLAWRGYISPTYYAPLEVTGLYWHFVDVVWIFLLPMLYLLGSHAQR